MRLLLLILCVFWSVKAAIALETAAGSIKVTPIVDGLTDPWAIGFLPDGGVLITEKEGRLLLLSDG